MKGDNYIRRQITKLDKQRMLLAEKRDQYLPFLFGLPLFAFFATFVITSNLGQSMISAAVAGMFSLLLHLGIIGTDFETLKINLKKSLISEFMKKYHPNIKYEYNSGKVGVREILREVNLVNAISSYDEEDVITGRYNNASFYFSEILLKSGGKSKKVIFDGFLFKLKISGKNFPKTRIQSKRNLLQKMFGNFIEDKNHQLWHETEDEERFKESLGPLLPFVSHLKNRQGDIKIHAENDELVILLNSEMNFLDEPNLELNKSFNDKKYKANLVKQLNSLLFIVDSLINNLDSSEIEQRLELKALEFEKLSRY